ncbi:MAG: NADH-ubiquinone oxidoreductase-F iron-sulfur binding region domain-containing protein [Alphaproteobacteria bacterium]|nr:NADH-ubiquinone oxidoreductase-F iron-sulfur binding region domain-containing protein [Alphaproteobacteria bacterium]
MSSEASNGGSIKLLGRPPGAGLGRGRITFPGRHASSDDLAEVRRIIGTAAAEPVLLVEYLHRIQDAEGQIRHGLLAALAECLRLSLAEVYEVATFYHRFEVVRDDAPPAVPTVHICDGLPCQMAGAEALAAEAEGKCRVIRSACMGRCDCAPVAAMGARYLGHADDSAIEALLQAPEVTDEIEPAVDFTDYQAAGGYALLRQCLAGERQQNDVIARLELSGLRGLGGAGFPTARKWALVAAEPGPRYLAVNGDESEPGTFKDRHYLESDPHRFIEGMLLAAWAVDAAEIYIYLRDEYAHLHHLLRQELEMVSAEGLCDKTIHLRRGAGAYICGEESAMLESIEGKRGLPRQRPPFPSQVGLFGRPTLINNVETLFWVRDAVDQGPAWPKMRSFSVSGRVREPGVKRVPAGISARALIDEHCGGMAEGHQLAAFLPGGASGGILPASLADQAMDFGSLEEHGGLIGSAALIVLSQQDEIAGVVGNLMRFFAHESCGQCTPCRVGTEKAVAMLAAGKAGHDEAEFADLAQVMADASICGLGHAAANPLRCALRHFPGTIA